MYLHKFYMHHSFLDVDHQAIATACLYLAIKADSRPVKRGHRIKVSIDHMDCVNGSSTAGGATVH